MQITTPSTNQSAIINFYKEELEKKPNVTVLKPSRGGKHLRINYKDDFNSLMNSILPCEIYPSENNISGSFTTYELKIKSKIPGANVGDKIYFVVTVKSSGIISNKELTPDKLGISGKNINKTSFITEAKTAVNRSTLPNNIKSFLDDLIEASNSPTGIIKSEHLESISDSDLNVIAKDFGEIAGAIWFMNQYQKKSSSIFYPSNIAAPLIDYYVTVDKVKIAISAKANAGAPPSINAIANILRPIIYNDQNKEKARKTIINISDKSVVDGIVESSKQMNTEGYKWLKKNLFKNMDFSAAQCETILSKVSSPKELHNLLDPYFTLLNRYPTERIIENIFNNRGKRHGFILYPLGANLVEILNTMPIFREVLNDAAKSIMVSQLYMNINKRSKTVNYQVKEFSASSFKFEYNAKTDNPSNKKISFKMEK
jgi:hypothetical protein